MDGRPRFDIEINTHNSENPALRRITSPAEISDACYDVLAPLNQGKSFAVLENS